MLSDDEIARMRRIAMGEDRDFEEIDVLHALEVATDLLGKAADEIQRLRKEGGSDG